MGVEKTKDKVFEKKVDAEDVEGVCLVVVVIEKDVDDLCEELYGEVSEEGHLAGYSGGL